MATRGAARAPAQRPEPSPPAVIGGVPPQPNESAAMYRARVETLRLKVERVRMLDRWDHKREGTPETHDRAARKRQGSLQQMFMAGQIDVDQLGWACEIASVAESLERDVEVKIAKYRMPVDNENSGKDALVEGIMRVRREVAYGWWRQRIPHPRRAVLDMLVGEPIPFTVAARRWRMGKRRAKELLIDALDLWPEAMDFASRSVDEEDLLAAHAGLLGG